MTLSECSSTEVRMTAERERRVKRAKQAMKAKGKTHGERRRE